MGVRTIETPRGRLGGAAGVDARALREHACKATAWLLRRAAWQSGALLVERGGDLTAAAAALLHDADAARGLADDQAREALRKFLLLVVMIEQRPFEPEGQYQTRLAGAVEVFAELVERLPVEPERPWTTGAHTRSAVVAGAVMDATKAKGSWRWTVTRCGLHVASGAAARWPAAAAEAERAAFGDGWPRGLPVSADRAAALAARVVVSHATGTPAEARTFHAYVDGALLRGRSGVGRRFATRDAALAAGLAAARDGSVPRG